MGFRVSIFVTTPPPGKNPIPRPVLSKPARAAAVCEPVCVTGVHAVAAGRPGLVVAGRGSGWGGLMGWGGEMGSRGRQTSKRGIKVGAGGMRLGWKMGGLCVCAAVLLLLAPGAAAQLANVRLTANVRPMAGAATGAGALPPAADGAGANGRGSLSGLQAQVPTVQSVLKLSQQPLPIKAGTYTYTRAPFSSTGRRVVLATTGGVVAARVQGCHARRGGRSHLNSKSQPFW